MLTINSDLNFLLTYIDPSFGEADLYLMLDEIEKDQIIFIE